MRERAVPPIFGVRLQASTKRTCLTNVMGFMKGILTSTASATKFSISRSIGKLYLALTYSGFAAYRQATRPPRGVMPTRSPIPSTAKLFDENVHQ